MLKPELQDLDVFADGMDNIVTTQKRVAEMYFEDGSIAQACPPLKALLHVMRDDQWEGKSLADAELRGLFTREAMLGSGWYAARLEAKQQVDRRLWRRHIDYLDRFLKKSSYADEASRLGIAGRLASARKMYDEVESPGYLERLRGTLGAEPIGGYLKG
jgi:hypothetical protein